MAGRVGLGQHRRDQAAAQPRALHGRIHAEDEQVPERRVAVHGRAGLLERAGEPHEAAERRRSEPQRRQHQTAADERRRSELGPPRCQPDRRGPRHRVAAAVPATEPGGSVEEPRQHPAATLRVRLDEDVHRVVVEGAGQDARRAGPGSHAAIIRGHRRLSAGAAPAPARGSDRRAPGACPARRARRTGAPRPGGTGPPRRGRHRECRGRALRQPATTACSSTRAHRPTHVRAGRVVAVTLQHLGVDLLAGVRRRGVGGGVRLRLV